jgi:hypothetical protein
MIPKLASLVLTMFTLMVLAALPVGGGILQAIPLPTAAFAQSPSSYSLADKIIEETATSVQDSSADDNVLDDNNQFGDEDAAIDQDNTEDQDDANVGLQDQDEVQEQDEAQDAANTNFDLDVQEGVQQEFPLPTPTPTQPPGQPGEPPEDPVFCFTWNDLDVGPGEPPIRQTTCLPTQQECQEFREDLGLNAGVELTSECQRFEETPSGALCPDPQGNQPRCE